MSDTDQRREKVDSLIKANAIAEDGDAGNIKPVLARSQVSCRTGTIRHILTSLTAYRERASSGEKSQQHKAVAPSKRATAPGNNVSICRH
jgi:hypothetical protein